jgi:hypothetical protein
MSQDLRYQLNARFDRKTIDQVEALFRPFSIRRRKSKQALSVTEAAMRIQLEFQRSQFSTAGELT